VGVEEPDERPSGDPGLRGVVAGRDVDLIEVPERVEDVALLGDDRSLAEVVEQKPPRVGLDGRPDFSGVGFLCDQRLEGPAELLFWLWLGWGVGRSQSSTPPATKRTR